MTPATDPESVAARAPVMAAGLSGIGRRVSDRPHGARASLRGPWECRGRESCLTVRPNCVWRSEDRGARSRRSSHSRDRDPPAAPDRAGGGGCQGPGCQASLGQGEADEGVVQPDDLRRDPALHRRVLQGVGLDPCRNHPGTRPIRPLHQTGSTEEGHLDPSPQKRLAATAKPVTSSRRRHCVTERKSRKPSPSGRFRR